MDCGGGGLWWLNSALLIGDVEHPRGGRVWGRAGGRWRKLAAVARADSQA